MEILQLQYFCEAARHQNFSRAAEKFQVPVSGVSFSVKRLEQELGKQLFTRTANKVRLTAEGKIFYDSAKRALELLDNAKSRIHDDEEQVRGRVKMAVLVNHSLINEIIADFKADYPDVHFSISHKTGAKGSEYDLMISDELLYFYRCSKFLLLKEDLVLAGRKDNPVMLGKEVDVELLRQQRFMSSGSATSMMNHTCQICYDLGITPKFSMASDDPHELIDFIEKGYGVAIVPSFDWGRHFSDNIALKPLGDYSRNTCVFYDSEKDRTKAVELFLKRLSEYHK